MLRTILSYSVLILIPAVSLGIAIIPYIIVKKKYQRHHVIASDRKGAWQSPSDATNEIASQSLAMTTGVSWKYLWLAFAVGLAGNVAWWWVIESVVNDKIAIYLHGMIDPGIMFSLFLYSIFLLLTPFLFFKLKYGHFTKRRVFVTILLTLLTIGLVAGVWVLLFAIAIRGIVERLN